MVEERKEILERLATRRDSKSVKKELLKELARLEGIIGGQGDDYNSGNFLRSRGVPNPNT